MSISEDMVRNIVEGALLAAGEPVSLDRLTELFEPEEGVGRDLVRAALARLAEECDARGVELREVASGWRLQVRAQLSPWVSRLWDSKPPRYSRALLETMALIAYQQPITRSDIEEVRGVSVSSNIIRTLLDRDWIRILGHRDVPGRPALYGTTRAFLDYFNLRSLDELPALAEILELDRVNEELGFDIDGNGEGPAPDSVPMSAVLGIADPDALEAVEQDESLAEQGAGTEAQDVADEDGGDVDVDEEQDFEDDQDDHDDHDDHDHDDEDDEDDEDDDASRMASRGEPRS